MLSTKTGVFSAVQFDDMETWEHTKLKPLSLPIAVDADSRFIIACDVVSMPSKGLLAAKSRKKYGPRKDDRRSGWKNVLSTVRQVTMATSRKDLMILSDSNPHYPSQIKKYLPGVRHDTVLSRKACVVGQGELKAGGRDPLFPFNHTAAMYRANVNRLFRRTWCTTKRPDRLLAHMELYRTYHNRVLLK